MRVTLEICVDDAAGVRAAVEGGADRIELCSALELGGLTPSAALIVHATAAAIPVHVMIRPRAGDFVYDADDVALMLDEIRRALAMGAAGIVVGASLPDGRLDGEALARFRDAARDGAAVLHRAIDLTPDPVAAVEHAAALGYDQVLSSGGAPIAIAGKAMLARMVAAARARLSIIAGAGVTPDTVAELVTATGVQEVHSSASEVGDVPGVGVVAMGFATGPRRRTSVTKIRRLQEKIAGIAEPR